VVLLDLARGSVLQGDRVKLAADLLAFQGRLGHRFQQPELLVQAVTHASLSSMTRPDNQRLEFLGDRVLGLAMAEALLAADMSAAEGQLAPRFNALVRKEACADVARAIGLGEVLKLGRSEMMSGGRRKEALLGDAMEAVIAAVYLDAGFEAARDLVLRLWGPRIGAVEADARDPKTALQEWAQARGQTPPVYSALGREGPDHQPVFTVEVRLASGETETAKAGTKRVAEQAAAKALLARMEGRNG
jgi:ribonuclease-3